MIRSRDNEFLSGENGFADFGIVTVLGDRERQEDCFGYLIEDERLLICVCDGMGGLGDGNIASRLAIETILDEYCENSFSSEPLELLASSTKVADNKIYNFNHNQSTVSNSGSTLVSIIVDGNALYWNSVGDSRLYINRNHEFIQVTKDQNYFEVLKEKYNIGEITEQELLQNKRKGEALINYLGLGNIDLIDRNDAPLKLKSGDRLIVCTDGLYKVLEDKEIVDILSKNVDIQSTLQMLEIAVRKKASEKNLKRDNMTVALVRIK